MTDAEAGQRLLEGKPWVKCNVCNGIGHRWERSGRGSGLKQVVCTQCGGFGVMIEKEYMKALELLHAPWPALPNILDLLTGEKHSDPDSIGG